MGAGQTTGILEKKFTAGGTIAVGQIVKFGSDDDTVVLAAAATDSLIGVAMNAAVLNGSVRVQMNGIADVKLGGTVARGALVTSDASGDGAAGAATNRVIGVAMKSGVDGDLTPVLLAMGIHT